MARTKVVPTEGLLSDLEYTSVIAGKAAAGTGKTSPPLVFP